MPEKKNLEIYKEIWSLSFPRKQALNVSARWRGWLDTEGDLSLCFQRERIREDSYWMRDDGEGWEIVPNDPTLWHMGQVPNSESQS